MDILLYERLNFPFYHFLRHVHLFVTFNRKLKREVHNEGAHDNEDIYLVRLFDFLKIIIISIDVFNDSK